MISYNVLTDLQGDVFFVLGSIELPEIQSEPFLFSIRPLDGTTEWELKSYIHQPPVRFPTWELALKDLTGKDVA